MSGLLALVLTGIAVLGASRTWGAPFPSLFLDAHRFYSLVGLSTWDDPLKGTRPPVDYRLHLPDASPLEPGSPLEWYARVMEPHDGDTVHLLFEGPEGQQSQVAMRPGRLGLEEVLFFFVTYMLVGWLVLWSGGMVLTLASRTAARRAYVFWSLVTFLFLLSFYDYHTTAWLSPLFSFARVGLPLSALWLAYAFPSPPVRGAVVLSRVLLALTGVGAVVVSCLVLSRFTGWDIRTVRSTLDDLLAPCIATLGVTVLVRLYRGSGLERTELRTAAWGLVATPLLIALTHVLSLGIHKDLRHLSLPFLVIAFPLSIGYALIRHNILAARVVLTPRMLRPALLVCTLLGSVLGTYALHRVVGPTHTRPTLLVLVSTGLFCALGVFAHRLQVRLFFPATLAFRGTVEGLSDRLTALREPPLIRRALEEVVMKTLPTGEACVLEPTALATLPHVPPESLEQLGQGTHVWTAHEPRERHLLVPMRSRGELRAVLRLSPKREAALYTQEDVQLLETLASLGALALHNAEAVEELESLRRLEVSAARKEKQLSLSALSAEVSHEMAYPLNFLQDLLRRGAQGQPLGEEDLDFAREEVARTRRMIDSLRQLQPPMPEGGPLRLIGPVQRALLLVRESIEDKRLHVTVLVDDALTVRAETDALVQLLSNLLRNAAQAAPDGGQMGIHAWQEAHAQIIEIWDTGSGIPEEVARVLFTPQRVSTKPGGFGIGLSVVQRIASSFHWEISFRRERDRTLFRLTLPPPPPPAENP